MSFRFPHLLASLLLHGVLFAALSVTVRCSPPPPAPNVMEAVLLDPSRSQVEQARRRKAAEAEAKAQQQRQIEEERRQTEERQRLENERVEAERRQQELTQKKKREAEEAVERERKQKLEEQRRDEQRKKDEQKRKQQERQRELERQERELLEKQMSSDASVAEALARERAVAAAQATWADLVAARVRKNWLRPPESSEDFNCTVQIEQLPGGQIIGSRITRSCGSQLLDNSVLSAIKKSDPLPLVSDPAAFQRSFTFIFVPKN